MKKLIIYIATILVLSSYAWAEEGSEIIWEQSEGQFTTDDFILSTDELSFYSYSINTVYEISTVNGETIRKIDFEEHFPGGINSIDVNDENGIMAITGNNEYILIWDLLENKELKRFTSIVVDDEKPQEWISVSFNNDGSKVAAVVNNIYLYVHSKLVVFDLITGNELYSDYKTSQNNGTPKWKSCEFSQSGDYLVAQLDKRFPGEPTDSDDSILIYDTENYEVIKEINNNFERNIDRGYYQSNYSDILGVRVNNTLEVYDLKNNTQSTKEFENYPYSVIFLDNSQIILMDGQTLPVIYQNNKIIKNFTEVCAPKLSLDGNTKFIGQGARGLICIDKNGTTSVDNKQNNQSTLFPNPTTGNLQVNFFSSEGKIYFLDIYDLDNNLIKSENLGILNKEPNIININLSDFPTGVYFLKIYNQKETQMFKVIKEK